jgi:hypothetical protein
MLNRKGVNMKNKFTHTGTLIGADSRTPRHYTFTTRLRETKNHWIAESGNKYRKHTGWGVGDWPLYYLDINSIKPNAANEPRSDSK